MVKEINTLIKGTSKGLATRVRALFFFFFESVVLSNK